MFDYDSFKRSVSLASDHCYDVAIDALLSLLQWSLVVETLCVSKRLFYSVLFQCETFGRLTVQLYPTNFDIESQSNMTITGAKYVVIKFASGKNKLLLPWNHSCFYHQRVQFFFMQFHLSTCRSITDSKKI